MPLILADEFASRSYELPTDLVRGELQVWSPSGMLKGLICTNVGCGVLQFVEDHNLGTAASNHTYILTGTDPDTVRGADLLYISYQKLPRDQITDDILRVAPEVVIEVENPPDRWLDFFEKIVDFLRFGVPVVIGIDPLGQIITIYRSDELPRMLGIDDTLTLPDVLPGFSVPVRYLFE